MESLLLQVNIPVLCGDLFKAHYVTVAQCDKHINPIFWLFPFTFALPVALIERPRVWEGALCILLLP